MIKIRNYKNYWDDMKERILNTLQYDVLTAFVRTESELAKKIKEVPEGGLVMVVVIPGSDTSPVNFDNVKERDTCIVYSLIKVNHGNMVDDDIVDAMEQTQNIITFIKEQMLADAQNCDATYHQIMEFLDLNRMHTDPEYEYFGCDGYSVSFVIQTNGF